MRTGTPMARNERDKNETTNLLSREARTEHVVEYARLPPSTTEGGLIL